MESLIYQSKVMPTEMQPLKLGGPIALLKAQSTLGMSDSTPYDILLTQQSYDPTIQRPTGQCWNSALVKLPRSLVVSRTRVAARARRWNACTVKCARTRFPAAPRYGRGGGLSGGGGQAGWRPG